MDTTTRTNVTDTGYSYGGKDYTYETRLDANNNPYRVDVPVGTAPALNKAPDGTQPLVYGGQPKVSTTTISNTNKINEVPKMVSNFEQMQKKGISTDASGVPRYADGSQVPDYTDPTIPEGTTPIYGTVNGVGNRIVGYNTPNLTSGGMTSTYLDSTGQSTAGTSPEDAQMNDYLEQMKSSLDASTKTLIDNIQKKFDIRRREQTDINARQKAGYTNALLMGGATGQGSSAQYAPISSEGIIGAQEAFGIKQLADLDSEEADLIAQAKAAQESGYTGGVGLIVDVRDGSILSAVTYPDFDANVMTSATDTETIQKYLTDSRSVFLHRYTSGLYAPGSIVKPVFALAALNEKIITPEEKILSTGSLSVPNPYNKDKPTIFRDWKAHGYTDVREAIAVSSDVYFYTVGGGVPGKPGLGISRLRDYAKAFGLSETLQNSFFSSKQSVIPDPEWKKKVFGEDWLLGNTYHSSIGQYGFQVTPLELVRAVATIANGGILVTPHVALDLQTSTTSLDLDQKNLKVILLKKEKNKFLRN